ncbi:MAG: hypothetical protein V8Q82_09565 [Christensenellales bacterium]
MVDVQRHGEIGIDAVGGGNRADGADLFMAGGDKIEIGLGIDALQRLHRAQQNGHAAAVINGFAGITIIEQLGKAASSAMQSPICTSSRTRWALMPRSTYKSSRA